MSNVTPYETGLVSNNTYIIVIFNREIEKCL